MKKKLIALLALTAMLLSLMAGCGNTNAPADDEPATEAPATEAPAAPDEPADEPPADEPEGEPEGVGQAVEHKYNFPGSDIAQLDYTNVLSMPLCEETETFTWTRTGINLRGPLAGIGIESYSDFDFIQYIEELANVEIEFTELNFFTYQENLAVYLSSGDFTDIISELPYTGGAPGALADEIILDLTDLIEDYAPNYYYMINSNPDVKSSFYEDGMVLRFRTPYDNFINNQGLLIRQDWLKEQNLEAPKTYDEMFNVLCAFRDAYGCTAPIYMNNDCTITGLTVGYDVASFSTGGMTSELPYFVVDGEVHCTLIEEGYKNYLQEMSKWYSEGLIDPDFITIQFDPFSQYLQEKVAEGNMGIWCVGQEGIDDYNEIDLIPLAAPTANADGIDHITTTSLLVDSMNDTYITTNCENVQAAMGLVDYFYSEDGIMLYHFGFEGIDYELDENNTPIFTDAVVNNEFELSTVDYMRCRCGYGVFSSMMLRYRNAEYNSPRQSEAWEVWTSNVDGSMVFPDNVSLTIEEAGIEGNLATDIMSYAAERVPRFFMGDLNFDSDWDEYVDTLMGSLDLGQCIEINQAAYERYLASVA